MSFDGKTRGRPPPLEIDQKRPSANDVEDHQATSNDQKAKIWIALKPYCRLFILIWIMASFLGSTCLFFLREETEYEDSHPHHIGPFYLYKSLYSSILGFSAQVILPLYLARTIPDVWKGIKGGKIAIGLAFYCIAADSTFRAFYYMEKHTSSASVQLVTTWASVNDLNSFLIIPAIMLCLEFSALQRRFWKESFVDGYTIISPPIASPQIGSPSLQTPTVSSNYPPSLLGSTGASDVCYWESQPTFLFLLYLTFAVTVLSVDMYIYATGDFTSGTWPSVIRSLIFIVLGIILAFYARAKKSPDIRNFDHAAVFLYNTAQALLFDWVLIIIHTPSLQSNFLGTIVIFFLTFQCITLVISQFEWRLCREKDLPFFRFIFLFFDSFWVSMYLLSSENWTVLFFFGVVLKGLRNIFLYDPYIHEGIMNLKENVFSCYFFTRSRDSNEKNWRLFNTNIVLSRLSDLLTYCILSSLAVTDYYLPGNQWLGSLDQNKGIDDLHSLLKIFFTYGSIELLVFTILLYRAYTHQETRKYLKEITKDLLRYKWAFTLVASLVVVRSVMYAITIAKK